VDRSGNAYVTGGTSSSDFPTTPGAFETFLSGDGDAFVAKLTMPRSRIIFPVIRKNYAEW
jgi:hypothetical protein